MARSPLVPDALTSGPFTRAQALEAGLTSRQLQGRHFVRVLPRVWVLRDHVMTEHDRIRAADLATPDDARVSHVSRLRRLGLFLGSPSPIHLVIPRDLHLSLPGVEVHRTTTMPPTDGVGLTPAAAFVTWAATARTLDLVMAGDWLLHRGHMSLEELRDVIHHQPRRPGAQESAWVSRFLDGRSRSVRESHVRCLFVFAGLPLPEVNVPVTDDPRSPCTDLYYRSLRVAAEFEGGQHFTDPQQIARDIGRYAVMRDLDVSYEQITSPMLDHPRAVVTRFHRRLVSRGYSGPAPDFGPRWRALFEPAHSWVSQQPRRDG